MKYRIKIITYKTNRKEYIPQIKLCGIWMGLDCDGNAHLMYFNYNNRETALEIIDKHYNGNIKSQSIEFEYIDKI